MSILLIIISFPFFLIQAILASTNDCPSRFCEGNPFPIRFPFQLPGTQPEKCGYPGFYLRCIGQKQLAVLNIPYSGDFWVRDINYLNQEIQLYLPYGCLASTLMNLNLSASPFTSLYYQNFTFLRCPWDYVTRNTGFAYIDCLSNSISKVIATSSMNLVRDMIMVCSTIANNLPIPVSTPQENYELHSHVFNEDLRLTWNVPDCQDCEARRGNCGFENSTTDQLFCFNHPRTEKPQGVQIFRIIALSIVVPAITCTICISCFMCLVERRPGDGRPSAAHQNSQTPAAIHNAVSGLDDSTIESYKKVVLGESRRLPGPNDATCPICLSEYHPKETLRCIPQCEHCFHSDCVDEWLRSNSTCPVCRNSPSPTRANA